MSDAAAFRNICSVPIRPAWENRSFSRPLEEGKVKNLTCMREIFAELMGAWVRDSPIPEVEERTYDVLYILTSLLAVFGNGLVIYVVLRNPVMRTSRNVLITNLALSNMFLGTIAYPLLWLPAKSSQSYGRVFCKLVNAVPGFNIYCSTLTISLMAFDRYRTVRSTRVSGRHGALGDGRWRAVLWAGLIWAASGLLVLPLILFYDTDHLPVFWEWLVVQDSRGGLAETGEFVFSLCSFPAGKAEHPVWAERVAATVSALQLAFLYVVPLLALLVFNYRLNKFLERNAERSLVAAARIQEDENSDGPRTSTATRRLSRTSRLLLSMALSYALLWLPFSIMSLLMDVGLAKTTSYQHKAWWDRWDRLAKFISILSVCVNPFLYGYLNTNFNREFRRIFLAIPLLRPLFLEAGSRRRPRRPDVPANPVESCPLQQTLPAANGLNSHHRS